MTQDAAWMRGYNEISAFIEREPRNPPKYNLDEYGR